MKKIHSTSLRLAVVAGATALIAASAADASIVRSATGIDAASITGAVNDFRADLGTLNANNPGSVGSGRREINWDAVPDTLAAPNLLPADFFNGAASPRARGAVFSTPGSGFAVSADSDNPTATPRAFSNVNAGYLNEFEPFSQQRLFTAVGSNITDVRFFVPGSSTPALVRGFGSIFSDVDATGSARIELYGTNDELLFGGDVLGTAGAATFSFLGASFDTPIVARARIISGTQALGGLDDLAHGVDMAVMDDFIYAEPTAVPEPASAMLLAIGAASALRRRA